MKTLNHCLNLHLHPNAWVNQVTGFQKQNLKTPAIVVLMAQSRNFGNYWKLILALISKQHFILMTSSTTTQIYKNSWCQEVIVSKVKTQLNIINFTWQHFKICLTLRPLSNSISSSILIVGLCMSPRSKNKVSTPSWRTPCSRLCTGEFILVDPNSSSV
jgi:hypothetical protein